jgi:outer membrane lipoprotein SlyB
MIKKRVNHTQLATREAGKAAASALCAAFPDVGRGRELAEVAYHGAKAGGHVKKAIEGNMNRIQNKIKKSQRKMGRQLNKFLR